MTVLAGGLAGRLAGRLAARYPGLASIARNGAGFIGGEWAEAGLRALYALLIARFLGPDQYGVWSYALAASGIGITLAGMGTEMLLPARVGRDRQGALAFLQTSLAVRLALLGLFAACFAVYAMVGESAGVERMALLLLVPTVLARGTSHWLRVMAVGFERAALAMRMVALVRLVEVLCGVSLLLAGHGVLVLLAFHSFSWVVEAGVLFLRLRALAPIRPLVHRVELNLILRHGAIVGSATALTGLLYAGPIILLRQLERDIGAVGQLGIALQLAMFAAMAAQGVLAAAQSVLSRAHGGADRRVAYYGPLVLAGSLLLAVPMWLGAHWLGVPVVSWVLGDAFAAAGALLPACLVLVMIVTAPNGFWQVQVLSSRPWIATLASFVAIVVLAALAPVAIGQFGPAGVIYASIAAAGVRALAVVGAGLALPDQKST